MNDLRFAFRQLVKNPGFTLVAIVTLALGIGANTAIFSLVNAVLLRPLPYANPERLVTICESNPRQGWDQYVTSLGTFRDWRDQSTVFADMGIIALSGGLLKVGDTVEPIERGWASASYFSTLGVKPILGRTFLPEEDAREHAEVVILSEGLWRRRFGGDPGIIGKPVYLGDRACTVVGVMPASFKSFNAPLVNGWESGAAVDLWWPPHTWPEKFKWRAMREYLAVGRLKPGVPPAQAGQELSAIAARLAREFPDSNQGWGVKVQPLHTQVTANARTAVLVLSGAAGLVLLIACANVANLQLARAAARRKEFAVRAALGAGRGRVARQLLSESLLLALPGAATGLLLAWWGIRGLLLARPANLPRLEEISLDARVLGFTLLLTLLAALLFGLFPALRFSRIDLNTTLRGNERGTSDGPGGNRLRGSLVISEVAIALLLLAGTGLLGRSLWQLLRVNPGFDPQRVFAADVSLAGKRYHDGSTMIEAVTRLAGQLNALPGVESAATVNGVPFGNQTGLDIAMEIQGLAAPGAAEKQVASLRQVSPRYFETMRMPVLRGRAFTEQDHAKGQPVAIINEAFTRRYFPNTDPIGQHLLSPDFGADVCEIVGVVRDAKQTGLDLLSTPEIYRPHFQSAFSELAVVVRSSRPAREIFPLVRQELQKIDPNLAPYRERMLADAVDASLAPRRYAMQLVTLFTVTALVLALAGVYGVVSCLAGQRLRELGIRAALGAKPGDLRQLVLRQGLALIVPGIAAGLLASMVLTRFLKSLLFNVAPLDALTLTAASLALLLIALIACWLPARRAANVNPITVLRNE